MVQPASAERPADTEILRSVPSDISAILGNSVGADDSLPRYSHLNSTPDAVQPVGTAIGEGLAGQLSARGPTTEQVGKGIPSGQSPVSARERRLNTKGQLQTTEHHHKFLGWRPSTKEMRKTGTFGFAGKEMAATASVFPSASSTFSASYRLHRHLPGAIETSGPGLNSDAYGVSASRAVWSDHDELRRSDGFNMKKWRAEFGDELGKAGIPSARSAQPFSVAQDAKSTWHEDTLPQERMDAYWQQEAINVGGILRDDGTAVAKRQQHQKHSAVRQRKKIDELGRHHREMCSERRRMDHYARYTAHNNGEASGAGGCDSNQELTEKEEAVQATIARIKARDAAKAKKAEEAQRLKLENEAKGTESASLSAEVPQEAEDPMKALRERIKIAVSSRLKQRRAQARKFAVLRDTRLAKLAKITDYQRNVLHEAFEHNCTTERGKQCVHAVDLPNCLYEAGLAGNNQSEKWSVDRVCKEMVFALTLEYGSIEKLPPIETFRGSLIPKPDADMIPMVGSEDRSRASVARHSVRGSIGSSLKKMWSDGTMNSVSKESESDIQKRAAAPLRNSPKNPSSLGVLGEDDEFIDTDTKGPEPGEQPEAGPSILDLASRRSSTCFRQSGTVTSGFSAPGSRPEDNKSSSVADALALTAESFWQDPAMTIKGQVSVEGALAAQALVAARQFMMTRPISFEDFAAEIVPVVRIELMEVRQDYHFTEFMAVIEASRTVNSTTLSHVQFSRLSIRLGIKKEVFERSLLDIAKVAAGRESEDALQELMELSKGNLKALKINKNRQDPRLTFEVVHEMLVTMEEQGEYEDRSLERTIAKRTGVGPEKFLEHRTELIRLYDYFQLYDVDASDALSLEEIRPLLKHIGLDPYRNQEAHLVNDLVTAADADGNESLCFDEFLDMMASVRAHQKLKIAVFATPHFDHHADCDGHMDIDRTEEALTACGIGGKTRFEQDLQRKVIYDWDVDNDGDISLEEFIDICQRAQERLFCHNMSQTIQYAEAIGICKRRLSEFLSAFDQFDVECKGWLKIEAIEKALATVVVEPPSHAEMLDLFDQVGLEVDEEVVVMQFLDLMRLAANGRGTVVQGVPFKIDDIPAEKLREMLFLYPLSEAYINHMEDESLADLISSYLRVQPSSDLREELSKPVGNVPQLIAFIKRSVIDNTWKRQETPADESGDGASNTDTSPTSATPAAAVKELGQFFRQSVVVRAAQAKPVE